MNNAIKNIGLLTLGAGIGSLVTWKMLKAYYEALVEEELESVRLMAEKERVRKANPGGVYVENEYESIKKRYNLNEERAEDVDPNEEEEEVDFPDDYETPPEYPTYPVPYPISEEEFSREHVEFDKLSLNYYRDDETLCDDQEAPIDDILQLVGQETEDYLAAVSGNNNAKYDQIVYVRNEANSSDFEITIVDNSYASAVLGYVPQKEVPETVAKGTKPKRQPRKKEENGGDE